MTKSGFKYPNLAQTTKLNSLYVKVAFGQNVKIVHNSNSVSHPHLPVPVAEGDCHHEPLQGVQQHIRVLVDCHQIATPRLYSRKNGFKMGG